MLILIRFASGTEKLPSLRLLPRDSDLTVILKASLVVLMGSQATEHEFCEGPRGSKQGKIQDARWCLNCSLMRGESPNHTLLCRRESTIPWL